MRIDVKIGLTSDTHLGLTKYSSIRKMLLELKEENPDIIVHAGDYNGGKIGYKPIRSTLKLIREVFPDTPIVSVVGNHEYWSGYKPSLHDFTHNREKYLQTFKDYQVHFLDTDGVYRNAAFPGLVIAGHSGWYHTKPDNSNDFNFLPIGLEGDTHNSLLRTANREVMAQLNTLNTQDTCRVFVSHMAVIDPGSWGWDAHLGTHLQELGFTAFLNGHHHIRKEGPLRWESGSDYCYPRHIMVNLTL